MLIGNTRHKLVHLNALRAFEAAARHLSFAAAADELNVTPPAISQQIRALEDYLEVKLFVRSKVGLSLTPPAIAAYPSIRDGLEKLAAGLGCLRSSGIDHIVTVTVPPSFAAKWLLPRIDRFREAHPQLDIRLDATNRLADMAAEGIDIGVRYGRGEYAGLECEKLMDEDVFPICSPALLEERRKPIDVETLAGMPLIHDTTVDFDPAFPTWRTWFAARGLHHIELSRGLQFNSSVLAIQAAIDGQGVALGRSVIVENDIRAGRLVRPCDAAESTRCAYYLVYERRALGTAKVKAIRDWLLAESS